MSATKNFYGEFLHNEHFVTDDTYEDFMRMQQENSQQKELQSIQEDELSSQHEGAKSNRSMNTLASNQSEFFSKSINDLPF